MAENLKLAVRMAIIPEISRQNYDTLAKQFREVIANSYDAKATSVNITVRKVGVGTNTKTDVVIEDNGLGMTKEEFKNDYLGIGGSPKAEDEKTIGRIGIGSLAVAVLSPRVKVESRKQGQDSVLVAELNIGELVRGIDRSTEVQELTIGKLTDRRAADEDPVQFTRITLRGVYDDTAMILNDKNKMRKVIFELRKILPLQYPQGHPLLDKMDADFKEILLDHSRLPSSDVFLTIPCLGTPGLKLERYAFGHFEAEDERISGLPYCIRPMTVPGGVNSNLTVFGYFVDAGAILPAENRGIVIRVKNMGVELNSFFEYNDAAANSRVTGEIFIENLDEGNAMTINRDALVKQHVDYLAICSAIGQELATFIKKEVRHRVDLNSMINKTIVKARDVKKAFTDVAEALSEEELDLSVGEEDSQLLKQFTEVDVEEEIKALHSSIEVYPLDDCKLSDIKYEDDTTCVTINADLLENSIEVGEDNFNYFIKKGSADTPPCEIDLERREIYINVGHPILEGRGKEIIKAVIALRFAFLLAQNDAEKMYNITLEILGKSF